MQKLPCLSTRDASLTPMWLFCSAWTIPSCFGTCSYWLLDRDLKPTTELAEHIAHIKLSKAKCDILEESLGLARVSECLQHMAMDVKLCASFAQQPISLSVLLFASPYPSAALMQGFAHTTHRYAYLNFSCNRFCETCNIVTWTQVQPSTVCWFFYHGFCKSQTKSGICCTLYITSHPCHRVPIIVWHNPASITLPRDFI